MIRRPGSSAAPAPGPRQGAGALARAALSLLALTQGVIGVWAFLAPRHFFASFPVIGGAWVASIPPYNEHLTRDVGSLSLAVAVTGGYAVARGDRSSARVAALAFGVYAVLHTLFHLNHLDALPTGAAVAQTCGFVLQVALVIMVLAADVRPSPPGRRRTGHVGSVVDHPDHPGAVQDRSTSRPSAAER